LLFFSSPPGKPEMALRGAAEISLRQSEQNCRRLSRNPQLAGSRTNVVRKLVAGLLDLFAHQQTYCDATSAGEAWSESRVARFGRDQLDARAPRVSSVERYGVMVD
jgi:hypothetical protein